MKHRKDITAWMPLYTDDLQAQAAKEARNKADQLKKSVYALGTAPEHLTENQQLRLEMIRTESPLLYRAYCIKERLRLILKMTSVAATLWWDMLRKKNWIMT